MHIFATKNNNLNYFVFFVFFLQMDMALCTKFKEKRKHLTIKKNKTSKGLLYIKKNLVRLSAYVNRAAVNDTPSIFYLWFSLELPL